MNSQGFPWLQSVFTKAVILGAGITTIALIGLPVPDQKDDPVSTSSLAQHVPSDLIANTNLSSTVHQVDLNRATAHDFEKLPGIGTVLAQRIVDYRQSHGHFKTIADLQEVLGIGEVKVVGLSPLVSVID